MNAFDPGLFPSFCRPLICSADVSLHGELLSEKCKTRCSVSQEFSPTFRRTTKGDVNVGKDIQQVPTPPTHKAGKELDLILARNCTTDNLPVTPLHLSDHFFFRFDVRLIEQPSVPTPKVSFRRNLRNLSPTHYSTLVSSALCYRKSYLVMSHFENLF